MGYERLQSNYQHYLSVNVSRDVIGDHLTGLQVFPQRLTNDIYARDLQHKLPDLSENVPLQTRRQMYNPPPPISPGFKQLDYSVCGYVIAMVDTRKMNRKRELPQ
jgi:hypothetical protein